MIIQHPQWKSNKLLPEYEMSVLFSSVVCPWSLVNTMNYGLFSHKEKEAWEKICKSECIFGVSLHLEKMNLYELMKWVGCQLLSKKKKKSKMELWKDPPVILVKYLGSIVFHRDRAEFYPEKKKKKTVGLWKVINLKFFAWKQPLTFALVSSERLGRPQIDWRWQWRQLCWWWWLKQFLILWRYTSRSWDCSSNSSIENNDVNISTWKFWKLHCMHTFSYILVKTAYSLFHVKCLLMLDMQ